MFKECPKVLELNGISQSSHMDQYTSEFSRQVMLRGVGKEDRHVVVGRLRQHPTL